MSNTATQETKRTIRFYSKEEIKALKPFINGQIGVNPKNLEEFCQKYNRSYGSVQVYVYNARKKKATKKQMTSSFSPKASLKKDASPAKLSKGEFKIPVNNWNIINENGQMYLTIKF